MQTARAYNGMVVTPHRLASEAGADILRQGGNAVEATVAAAAVLCVVYPHMTGLGGDGFWLILPKGAAEPVYIDACGPSGRHVSQAWYTERGCTEVPRRGGQAALTMAGAVSGWDAALGVGASLPRTKDGRRLGLDDVFAAATAYAEEGFPVSASQHGLTREYLGALSPQPGFSGQFLHKGKPPEEGSRMTLPALAQTFRRLCREGLDSFYRGSLAADLAADLAAAGSPLTMEDFTGYRAVCSRALSVRLEEARVFTSPPPTQGVASLMILALFERFIRQHELNPYDPFMFVHALVEATKQAFLVRDRHVADPGCMAVDPAALLQDAALDPLLAAMDPGKALPWPVSPAGGDTVWLGAMDAAGNAVSCIQSIYHEFGSGVVAPSTGVTWQNRGLGFTFAQGRPNSLGPWKKPFHTLCPALARFNDGRILSYGTMGGEGQPQTQAAVFTRYARLGVPLQQAITLPRWLLGRAWGDASASLKMEQNFPAQAVAALRQCGHEVTFVPPLSLLMGHAGALALHPDGLMEGGFDPRSDGSVGFV